MKRRCGIECWFTTVGGNGVVLSTDSSSPASIHSPIAHVPPAEGHRRVNKYETIKNQSHSSRLSSMLAAAVVWVPGSGCWTWASTSEFWNGKGSGSMSQTVSPLPAPPPPAWLQDTSRQPAGSKIENVQTLTWREHEKHSKYVHNLVVVVHYIT